MNLSQDEQENLKQITDLFNIICHRGTTKHESKLFSVYKQWLAKTEEFSIDPTEVIVYAVSQNNKKEFIINDELNFQIALDLWGK